MLRIIYEYMTAHFAQCSSFALFMMWLIWGELLSVRYIHMLQQNSYFASRYLRWVRGQKHFAMPLSGILPVLGYLLIGKSAEGATVIGAILYLVLIAAFLIRPKTSAKKPLVYTARVKRMMVIFAAVSAVLFLIVSLISYKLLLGFAVILGILLPIYMALVLYAAEPIEAAIRQWYYNDAKKKLAAMPDLIVIGVTGSYGKTSTKHVLTKLLSEKYNVLMTPGSFNTTMGVVRTIREQLSATHQVFVVEMGAKNRGDIKEICDLVKPKYGIISSIGPQHLETFGSMENIAATKFELAEAVRKNGGVMFLNYDNEWIRNREFKGAVVTYGTKEDEDFYACGISPSTAGSVFSIKIGGEKYTYQTRLLGALNVINITAATAVCRNLGMQPQELTIAIRRLAPVEHRLQLIPGGRYTVIDDAYNANPEGAAAALETLKGFSVRRIIVTPGMVELGSEQEKQNEAFGRLAAHCCDDIVLVGKKQAGPIEKGVLAEGFSRERLFVAEDLSAALAYVNKIAIEPSVVLLENDLPDSFL